MDAQISKDLQYVIAALPSFGTRYAHLVMGYAQLFGVTPMHLKAKKLRLIVEEMKKLFDAQSFAWQKNFIRSVMPGSPRPWTSASKRILLTS